jgi:hypothetical protein
MSRPHAAAELSGWSRVIARSHSVTVHRGHPVCGCLLWLLCSLATAQKSEDDA